MAPVSYIKKGSFELSPNQKVIKANDYLSCLQAKEIISKAEQEAQAKAEYESEKQWATGRH